MYVSLSLSLSICLTGMLVCSMCVPNCTSHQASCRRRDCEGEGGRQLEEEDGKAEKAEEEKEGEGGEEAAGRLLFWWKLVWGRGLRLPIIGNGIWWRELRSQAFSFPMDRKALQTFFFIFFIIIIIFSAFR